MLPVEKFSLLELPASHQQRDYQRRLLMDGKALAVLVYGDELAAQYQFGSLCLVVTAYDYFDGVNYWFYLLNPAGKVVDMASTPDYFGFIEWHEAQFEDELRFGFYGSNDRWHLLIRQQPFWSFEKAQLALRMNRFMFCKRHLTFTCTKAEP